MLDRAGLARRLTAEALGTGLLVATVVGSGIMAERLAGNAGAVALLCNTLPTAAILYVLIAMLGPVSGAHLNPAVSLVFALRRVLTPENFLLYVVAQIAGGVAGTFLAHMMFAEPILQASLHERAGAGQWLSEAVATFGLVLVVLGMAGRRLEAVAASVALYIGAAYWFTASTSFANPAVTLARALTGSYAGIRPIDAPGFIAAQLVGALLALALAGILFDPD
ncbi:MAG TPA: MIP/aquaporin family protein [Devosiaceae bacterium]